MRIYIIDLESVPTRYTCEWKGHIPALLEDEAKLRNRPDVEIINISGGEAELKATLINIDTFNLINHRI